MNFFNYLRISVNTLLWGILFDKRYVGLRENVWEFIPKTKAFTSSVYTREIKICQLVDF